MREGLFIIGRGVGQVMFQNNAVSGLLMLVGIACNSWLLALFALFCRYADGILFRILKRRYRGRFVWFQRYVGRHCRRYIYGDRDSFPPFVGGGFRAFHMDSPRVWLSETFARFHGSFHSYRMVVVGPLPLVVSLIVVAFCDVGRNDVRLVSGFQSEYRSGHVPRRHGAFRTFLFGRHIAQLPCPCLVYGVGSLVAFGHGLDGRFRLCDFQCRFVWV